MIKKSAYFQKKHLFYFHNDGVQTRDLAMANVAQHIHKIVVALLTHFHWVLGNIIPFSSQ